MNDHLYSKCFSDICRDLNCKESVKQSPSGRWYITMGHAGFNTRANNGNGYASKNAALFIFKKYTNK